ARGEGRNGRACGLQYLRSAICACWIIRPCAHKIRPQWSNSMADEHPEPGGMKVLRLYADALGESRFETTTMPMSLKEFAPPAAPLRVSDPQPAQNYVVIEVDAKWGAAVPHPSPARMMAFCLSGCTRQTASSGESHTFVAGDCLLHDDTSGKGHSTEVISDVPARWVFIRLPN